MRYCPTCGRRLEDQLQFCPDDGARSEPMPDETAGEPEDKLIGRTVDGRYRVEKRIGQGGMGNVYSAMHVVLNRKLALKVLAGDMARNPEVVQRFQQEAQSATAIGHQNIIDIVDFGTLPDGTAYFVMEYLDGKSLTGLMESGQAPPQEDIVSIMRQMAEALGAAHARGIVHRDLKPDNVFVIRKGDNPNFVKVLDFGIAKVGGAASKLTQTGVIFGTPHYMAPEQAAGQSVDHRADIYSMGIILYEMCIGKVPFDADTYMAILSKHMFEQPPVDPTVVEGRVLGPFQPIVLKALAKKPEERYQSMLEVISDLDVVAQGGTPDREAPVFGARRTGRFDKEALPSRKLPLAALFAVAGLLAVGVGGWMFFGGDAKPAPSTDAKAQIETGAVDPPKPAAASSPEPAKVEPRVEERVVMLTSAPDGATVYRNRAIVGTTPLPFPCPAAGVEAISLSLELEGYETATVEIATCQKQFPVTLKKEKVAVAKKGGHKPKTPGPAKTGGGGGGEVVDPWQ